MSRGLFGRPGDPPTDFETALLARTADSDDRWVAIGKRIGAKALFVVLDELGGLGTFSAPSRETFVMRLYRPVRDAEIADLVAGGADKREVAKVYHLTRQAVDEAMVRSLKRLAPVNGRNGA